MAVDEKALSSPHTWDSGAQRTRAKVAHGFRSCPEAATAHAPRPGCLATRRRCVATRPAPARQGRTRGTALPPSSSVLPRAGCRGAAGGGERESSRWAGTAAAAPPASGVKERPWPPSPQGSVSSTLGSRGRPAPPGVYTCGPAAGSPRLSPRGFPRRRQAPGQPQRTRRGNCLSIRFTGRGDLGKPAKGQEVGVARGWARVRRSRGGEMTGLLADLTPAPPCSWH